MTLLMSADEIARIRKIEAAIDVLFQKRCYITKHMLQMGFPRFVENDPICDTACVTLDHSGNFGFLWDTEFFDDLDIKTTAFVFCHETMHIVLGHLERIGDRDRRIANIAADIVVNYLLEYNYSFTIPSGMIDHRDFQIIGIDPKTMSFEQIYDRLLRGAYRFDMQSLEESSSRSGSHDNWEDIVESSNGTIKDQVKRIIKEVSEMHGHSAFPSASHSSTNSAGNGVVSELRNLVEDCLDVNVKWDDYVSNFLDLPAKRIFGVVCYVRRFAVHFIGVQNCLS